ncbi:hypothetical protein PSMK_31300 [Phycisphaera mikurensis NBRC 102666]|uniref:Uncharacterized protein n=1 Tax=Phycisphaera mikurensis (strain NBRC 102666 / KCTC 22515 / FYK2301M01) TaxID=1142394 RepID=I0IJ51_PHYMF|nr:hypothetical protein PSMK_31300 [Phycisphaera mikurensis NBRC 102666]
MRGDAAIDREAIAEAGQRARGGAARREGAPRPARGPDARRPAAGYLQD